MNKLKVLTTGEAARHCGVNFRTVIRWIERGQLKAYKLPGRGDHRIRVGDFIAFLRHNEMPVPAELEISSRKALLLASEPGVIATCRQLLQQAGCEVNVIGDSFTAGATLTADKPSLLVIDAGLNGLDSYQILDHLRSRSEYALLNILLLASEREQSLQRWLDAGADAAVPFPPNRNEIDNKIKFLLST
ncbi:MAG: helix-turn-helix domain-containing protein [Gammaproteobacteria bacterium]|nr:helix-turn-helix domain-containing protein [Gammaproteobacteria bacterium]